MSMHVTRICRIATTRLNPILKCLRRQVWRAWCSAAAHSRWSRLNCRWTLAFKKSGNCLPCCPWSCRIPSIVSHRGNIACALLGMDWGRCLSSWNASLRAYMWAWKKARPWERALWPWERAPKLCLLFCLVCQEHNGVQISIDILRPCWELPASVCPHLYMCVYIYIYKNYFLYPQSPKKVRNCNS